VWLGFKLDAPNALKPQIVSRFDPNVPLSTLEVNKYGLVYSTFTLPLSASSAP